MGDIASGVYLKITDNSFSSAGRSSVRIIVPMYLKKGEVGLNEVNGSNFKDIVGYDSADSKYLGLEDILKNVASCVVWRTNAGSVTYAAQYMASASATSWTAASSITNLSALDSYTVAIAPKYPGTWAKEDGLQAKIEAIPTGDNTYSTTEFVMVTKYGATGPETRTPFSLLSSSDDYWGNIDFKDIYFHTTLTSSLSYSASTACFNFYNFANSNNGSNGTEATASNLDISKLDGCGCNILLTNGSLANTIVIKMLGGCAKNKIHMFADVPDNQTYSTIATYAESITKNTTTMRYLTLVARPEKVGDVLVHASCKYAEIFANMLSATGSLNYPPAGATYGTVTIQELMPCDYELYKDDMKTNRINYLTVNSLGTMMWEQRTMYADNTDLSYIAPNFIIDELSDLIIEHERRFNFRYMTDTDLSVNKSGLVQILNSYVDKGFLYSYSLKVPNVQEAQASGRTLNIMIKVQVMKDSEVINIDLQLTNNVNA